jgi:hypothetical protein
VVVSRIVEIDLGPHQSRVTRVDWVLLALAAITIALTVLVWSSGGGCGRSVRCASHCGPARTCAPSRPPSSSGGRGAAGHGPSTPGGVSPRPARRRGCSVSQRRRVRSSWPRSSPTLLRCGVCGTVRHPDVSVEERSRWD